MFETALQKMLELGHDVNPDYWTRGERGFSNVCLNCGQIVGVLKTGALWGTAIEGPCPDQRWHSVTNELSSSFGTGKAREADGPKYKGLQGIGLLLVLLAITVGGIATLANFHLLSSLLLMSARISMAIGSVALVVAIFRLRGFAFVIASFVLAVVFFLLADVFMSPEQVAEREARQKQEQQQKDAEQAAAKADAARREQDGKVINEHLQAEKPFQHNRNLVAGNAAVKAAEWTRHQMAPFVVTFDCPPLEDSDVCNFAYAPTWDDDGGLHEHLVFRMLNGNIRRTTHCYMLIKENIFRCSIWNE